MPRPLFHLFSFYGDVVRVKILPHKVTVALVEFETATMACIARNNLDQIEAMGKKLVVSFSRYGNIKKPDNAADGLTEDYTGAEYKQMHRFSRDDLMSVNLKRICKPTSCLHVNNMTQGCTPDQVKATFVNFGLRVLDMVAIKKMKERNKDNAPSTPSRAIIFLQFKNQADAIIGLALANGSGSSSDIPAGLRVSFTETSVAAERAKCEASTVKASLRMEVAANNQPL